MPSVRSCIVPALCALLLVAPDCHHLFAQGADPFGGPDPFGGNLFDGDPFDGDPFGDAEAEDPAPKPRPRRAARRIAVISQREGQQPAQPAQGDARIEKELATPTILEFRETPLSDAVKYIGELHRIDVQLDERALEDIGIAKETPLTFQVNGISLRSALRLMLRGLDLTFVNRGGALLISTPETACGPTTKVSCGPTTKVFRIDRLVRPDRRPPVGQTRGAAGPDGGDELRDLLANIVRPTTWEDVGGPGSMQVLRNTLIVSNHPDVVREIEASLAMLERAGKIVEQSRTNPPEIASLPEPAGWKKRIHAALAEKIDCHFQETPLQDVADFLATKGKINILIDRRALEDVGIGADTGVTFQVRGISMGSALSLLLREWDLTYVVRHEVLLITTPEEAEDKLETRIFPVADLAVPWDEDERWLNPAPWWAGDYESLIELITATVRPAMWEEVGGPGAIDVWHGCLVVAQTREVFEEVEVLLAGLRKLKSKRQRNPQGVISEPIKLDEINTPALAELRAALQADVGMLAFNKMAMRDVMQQISRKHNVPIVIDHRALEDIGVRADAQLSATLGGESLAEALRRLLRPFDLTWVVRHEVVLITTPEEAEGELVNYIYPVADLVLPEDHEMVDIAWETDFDSVIDALTSTVRPTTWGDVGGPGFVDAYHPALALVVSQSEEVHVEIAALLAQIRQVEAVVKAEAAEEAKEAVDENDDRDVEPAADNADDADQAAIPKNARGERLYLKVYRLSKQDRAFAAVLADVIRELVEPQSWKSDEPYYLRPLTGSILVRHTASAHRKIDRLLRALDAPQWPPKGGGLGSAAGEGGPRSGGRSHPSSGGVFVVPDDIRGQIGAFAGFGGGLGVGLGGGAMCGAGMRRRAPVTTVPGFTLPASDGRPAMPLRVYDQDLPGEDDVAEIISELVAPDGWQREGRYLRAVGGKLLVRHEPNVHRQVYRLMIELGAMSLPIPTRSGW